MYPTPPTTLLKSATYPLDIAVSVNVGVTFSRGFVLTGTTKATPDVGFSTPSIDISVPV